MAVHHTGGHHENRFVEANDTLLRCGHRGSAYSGRYARRGRRARGGIEVGVTTWISNGQTDWNHDASGVNPLFGNPTSVLTYKDVDTTILEFNAKVPLPASFFVRGNIGVGVIQIGDGNLRDDDFFAGQVLFSSTDSVIADTDVFYVTLDVGRPIVRFGNNGSLSPFVGLQYWREKYEAFGIVDLFPGGGDLPTSTLVFTNKVEWISFRLGAIASTQLTDSLNLSVDAVFIPFTDMNNEDSHHLRTDPADLGPVPNIIMNGRGQGFQGEAKLGYEFTDNLTASLGFRYWTMMSDGDIVFGPNSTSPSPSLPLNDLDTVRWGVRAGIVYRF